MDREKVIKWLDVCKTADRAVGLKEDYPCRECPYKGSPRCMRELVEDALALLKEQEAKQPAIMQNIEGIWSTCSMCGYKLRPILAMKMDTYFPKFCPECGQAVKWE